MAENADVVASRKRPSDVAATSMVETAADLKSIVASEEMHAPASVVTLIFFVHKDRREISRGVIH